MPGQPVDQLLILVFFIYGLAFFGMGLTLALESERFPALTQARLLRPLAAFGMIHGTHEWLESYLMQSELGHIQLPGWLPWLRLGLLIASFCSLMFYGSMTLLQHPIKPQGNQFIGLGILGLYYLGILTSTFLTYRSGTIPWQDLLDGLTRYLFAVPGAVLAALALRAEALEARLQGQRQITVFLTWAAAGFGLYSLTQVFVPPLDMFPARVLNTVSFRAFTGFPIQIVRTIAAVIITISLLRATQVKEKERQRQLIAVQNERLEALERIREELTNRESMRRELLRHTVQAQEEERARIARELHDETSQVLTAFTLDLATLSKTVSRQPGVKELVERLKALSKQMSQALYHLVHDLRPAQLDDLGLIPALEYLKEDSLSKGLAVSITVEGKPRRLDPTVETVLFRVAQEALTNTVRHAHTDQAGMCLCYKTQEVILRVADSGSGFNPVESFIPPRGWGLAGMRERVESVSGELHIDSTPDQGTTVEVVIPVFDILP